MPSRRTISHRVNIFFVSSSRPVLKKKSQRPVEDFYLPHKICSSTFEKVNRETETFKNSFPPNLARNSSIRLSARHAKGKRRQGTFRRGSTPSQKLRNSEDLRKTIFLGQITRRRQECSRNSLVPGLAKQKGPTQRRRTGDSFCDVLIEPFE